MLIVIHNNTTSQLVSHNLDSRKLLRDLLKELDYYQMQVSIYQALAIDNDAYYNPFLNPY